MKILNAMHLRHVVGHQGHKQLPGVRWSVGRATAAALFFVFATAALALQPSWGQVPVGYTAPALRSVTLHPVGVPMGLAFIPLQGGQLELRFDDLDATFENYRLRVQHCTFDWFPSPDMVPSDYLRGFRELAIDDVEASFNTRQGYSHHRIVFPDPSFEITRSGNYLVEVFKARKPEEVVLSRRFVVYESLCPVTVQVGPATSVGLRRSHVEVDHTVAIADYPMPEAGSGGLQTVILQNGRWDNAISALKPVFVKDTEVIYNHSEVNRFPGGVPYRFIDLKGLRFAAQGVAAIDDNGEHWRFWMEPLEPRVYQPFRDVPDINGRFQIRNDRQEDHTGGDYVMVHFELPMDPPLYGEDIYLFGDLSVGQFPPTHRFQYNAITHRYELELLLKQGYYNYVLLTRPEKARGRNDIPSLLAHPGSWDTLEGTSALNENQYTVIAYYWDRAGYDRVVGIEHVRYP